MELFKYLSGAKVTHVPYKSNGPAYNDLVGNRVNTMITTINSSVPYIKGGKMKLLAVLDNERSPLHPAVPTMRESGFPGLNVNPWNAMMGPAGLPADVLGAAAANPVPFCVGTNRDENLLFLAFDPTYSSATTDQWHQHTERQFGDRPPQAERAIFLARNLQLDAEQIERGRRDRQSRHRRRDDGVGETRFTEQHVIGRDLAALALDAEAR